MKVIIGCSLLERFRKKELYIIFAIGVVLIFLFCTGDGSISIDGQALTGFDNRLMLFHIFVNAITCLLSVVLSVNTIPNEYERRNSHLIWIRNVSQTKYHASLCIANIIVNLIVLFVFYLMLAIFLGLNAKAQIIPLLIPGYLLTGLNVIFICTLTSALSIKCGTFVTGLISILIAVFGIFYPALELIRNIMGGIGAKVIGFLMTFVPNLHMVQKQALEIYLGKNINLHELFVILFFIYIASLGIIIFRREEA